MEDTCKPKSAQTLQAYRIYTIIVPALLMIFILECVYVFMSIPATLGTALSIKGPFTMGGLTKNP
jgi:hypothetical protein